MHSQHDKKEVRRIAKERIEILFSLAEKYAKTMPERAKRYIELAIKIGMRCNVPIPKNLKRRFCKRCHAFLTPGLNCRVRTRKDKQAVVVKCLECGNIMRYPYIKEKKNK